ncbi:MAG: helix-turn-helix domain-containing protein, partial [Proteobacteria bacterium]|nr:helix-turn-helix domain-containing protein [Pseudomonadota bacterium]
MQQNQERKRNDSKEIDEQRWQAVCNRDQTWDGIFVFAVRTTGVYCRPSCTSRRANRENVSFHDTPAQAQAAGYRACKRCKPNQVESSSHSKAIAQACRSIELAEEKLDLARLAASAGLSPGHFQRVFKAQVGLSPKQYAMALRKQRFRNELKSSKNVTQTIYEAGYD